MVLTLAIPIALQNLLSSSLAIIDNLMVGKLGDISVASVGVSAQIAQLVNIYLLFGAVHKLLNKFKSVEWSKTAFRIGKAVFDRNLRFTGG